MGWGGVGGEAPGVGGVKETPEGARGNRRSSDGVNGRSAARSGRVKAWRRGCAEAVVKSGSPGWRATGRRAIGASSRRRGNRRLTPSCTFRLPRQAPTASPVALGSTSTPMHVMRRRERGSAPGSQMISSNCGVRRFRPARSFSASIEEACAWPAASIQTWELAQHRLRAVGALGALVLAARLAPQRVKALVPREPGPGRRAPPKPPSAGRAACRPAWWPQSAALARGRAFWSSSSPASGGSATLTAGRPLHSRAPLEAHEACPSLPLPTMPSKSTAPLCGREESRAWRFFAAVGRAAWPLRQL